jgi:hypothetical protein
MSCAGCVDGKASDTCAMNGGDGDDDADDADDDEGHHLSSPSLPSLPSQRMMGRKRKRRMAIRRANAGVAGTGRACGCSAGG